MASSCLLCWSGRCLGPQVLPTWPLHRAARHVAADLPRQEAQAHLRVLYRSHQPVWGQNWGAHEGVDPRRWGCWAPAWGSCHMGSWELLTPTEGAALAGEGALQRGRRPGCGARQPCQGSGLGRVQPRGNLTRPVAEMSEGGREGRSHVESRTRQELGARGEPQRDTPSSCRPPPPRPHDLRNARPETEGEGSMEGVLRGHAEARATFPIEGMTEQRLEWD